MAAPILTYEGLGLIQGEGWLFRGLDLYVGERDRLALIGRNGAGKTTLLKCLADMIETDEGKRTIVPGTHVVLLEQDPAMTGFDTLETWVLHGPDARRPTKPQPLPISLVSTFRVLLPQRAVGSGAGLRSLAHWRRTPTCCCSTNRPTTSIWAPSNGWRNG